METTQILKFMTDKFNEYNLGLAIDSGMSQEDAEKYVNANKEYAFMILSKVFKDMVSEGHIAK